MGNKLSLGYEYEENERDLSEVDTTNEHTVNAMLSMNPFSMASGWVKFSYATRNGDTYISNQPFLEGHDPAVIAALAATDPDDLFENDPLLRKFYMADRDRTQVTAAINFYPSEIATLSVTGKYKKDDYDETEIGLQESKNTNITFDVTLNPADTIGTYAFITYDNYENNQRSFRRGGSPALVPGGNRNVPGWDFWTIDTEDDVYTLGAGLDWVIEKDKFTVNADFLYSRAMTEVRPDSASLAFLPFPELTTRLTSVNVTGEYKFKEDMGIRLKYQYERFKTRDFALDLVTPNILANVLLLGDSSPDYNAHVIGLTYFYSF